MTLPRLLATVLVLAGAGLAAATYMREFILVDACLDRGGSFNYATGSCDAVRSHPFIPFIPRHTALLTCCGGLFAAGLITLATAPRQASPHT